MAHDMRLFHSTLLVIFWVLAAQLTAARVEARPEFAFPKNPVSQPAANLKPTQDFPNAGLEVHKVNRMALLITNNGFFGRGYLGINAIDPETGDAVMACEYPINSNIEYLWVGGLWLGAVVGRDTLVSTGAEGYYYIIEFWPAPARAAA